MSDFLPQHYLTQLVQRTWGGLAPIQPVVSNRFVWGSGWTEADSVGISESSRFPEAPVLPDAPSVSAGLLAATDLPESSDPPLALLFSEPSPEVLLEPSPLDASPLEVFPSEASDEALSVERSQRQPSLDNPEIVPSDQPIVQPIQPKSASAQPIQPQSPPTRLPDPAVFEPRPSTTLEEPEVTDVTAVSTPQTVTSPVNESVNEVTGSAIEVDHGFFTEISSGVDAQVPVPPVYSPLLQRKALIEPAPLIESNISAAAISSESIPAISEQTPPEQTIQGAEITNTLSPSNTSNTFAPPPAESSGESNAVPFIETPVGSSSVFSNPTAPRDLPIQPPLVQLPTEQQSPLISPNSPPLGEPPISLKSQPTHSQSADKQALTSSSPSPRRSPLQASTSPEAVPEQGVLPMVAVVQRLFAPRAQRSTTLPINQSPDRPQLASQPANQSDPIQKSPEMTLSVPLSGAITANDTSSKKISKNSLNHDSIPLITHAIEPNISPVATPMDRPQNRPSKVTPKVLSQIQRGSSIPFSDDAFEVPARNVSDRLSDQFSSQNIGPRSAGLVTDAPEPPPIKITIGRIDVKVTTPEPTSSPVRQKRQRPNVSLQKYLQQRGEK